MWTRAVQPPLCPLWRSKPPSDDSEAFCRRMLDETGIAATPGTDFDPDRGHRYVRFSFAGATGEMAEAARLLEDWRR